MGSFNIMALDIGTHMGVAVGNKVKNIKHFPFDLSNKNTIKVREHKLAVLMNILPDWINNYKPDVVIYEKPFVRGDHATRMLWRI